MKILPVIFFTLSISILYGQALNLKPVRVIELDFSPDIIAKFNSDESTKECEKVYNRLNKEGRSWSQLTEDETNSLLL